ncbi:MAG: aminotransferase class I/II-fold pyridoxal phosphate-dependent enzyme [Bacteroidales bacterium]|nr:aminotransferase class I/II-fold pyridoxal phosphate-dependent enzyme [Bacteroidales bacterium]
MIQKLKKSETLSRLLEPDESIRKIWLDHVLNYSEEFLNTVNDRNAFNEYSDEQINVIKFDISENPETITDIISQIEKDIDIPGLNPASGGHLGYIPGGGVYATALGDYLAAVFNKYAGIYYAGPGPVKLENSLIRWMCSIIGFPKTALGNLTSGGSIATLIAIATARDAQNITSKNVSKSVIYLTEQAHHSVEKAIRISGLNEAIIRYVPMTEDFRMNKDVLRNMVKDDKDGGLNPFLLVSAVGTTDTGAIDPLDDIAEIASENNIWMHTDAAYGGFFFCLIPKRINLKALKNPIPLRLIRIKVCFCHTDWVPF